MAYLQAQNANADYLSELNKLKNELADAQHSLDELEKKINLHKSRDEEIEKLQAKAREFENYMRTDDRKNISSPHSREQSSSESPKQTASSLSDDTSSEGRINAESKMRDEMARIFANQIKTTEKEFVETAKKLQRQIIHLENELDAKTAELEVASEQIDLLKFAIVSEREEFERILKQKNESVKERVEKYQKHVSDLNEQIDMIESERALIDNLRKQIDEERSILSKKEIDTAHKLKKLQEESSKIIEGLNEKYKKAKKTAENYKQVSIVSFMFIYHHLINYFFHKTFFTA